MNIHQILSSISPAYMVGYNAVKGVRKLFDNSSKGVSTISETSPEASLNNELFNQAAIQQMDYQTQSAQDAMRFNSEEAKKARDWSEMMSNTAYQRSVKDLKAAGLNPILAYTNGPASTPGSTSATGYAQQGAMANVDTQDWKSNQKQAKASMLNAVASMTFASAKVFDSIASNYHKNLDRALDIFKFLG